MSNGLQHSYVNASSLMFFSDRISPAFEADVLTSTLLFSLAASAKCPAFGNEAAWRQEYLSLMNTFEWMIDTRNAQDFSLEANESIWGCLKETLGKRVCCSLLEAAEKKMHQLLTEGDSRAVTLLRQQTVQCVTEEGDVSVPPAVSAQEKKRVYKLSMQLGFIDTQSTLNLVFISLSSTRPMAGLPLSELCSLDGIDGNLQVAVYSAELDEDAFARFRPSFLEKLGAKRQALIIELDGAAS